jgi:hypothetical protein
MRASSTTLIHQEREREFLSALESDTGRTLAQWMDAIRAEQLDDRNAIIDWLRRQGFRFSRASWLERVHHNGGRPIYADQPVVDRATVRRPPASPKPDRASSAAGRPAVPVLGNRPSSASRPPPAALAMPEVPRAASEAYATASSSLVPLSFADPLSPEIAAVTAKAKAYRPLADFLLREIAKAVPGATFAVRGQTVVALSGRDFATLGVSARELKLTLAGAGTIVLTDARQVDASLLARITAAARTTS